MEHVASLRLHENVDVRGTNWEFVGEAHAPAWRNTETGHHLIVEPATSALDYALKINHPSQVRPWWTVTEVDFPAELLPIVEWFVSAPEETLYSREAVAHVLEPFWETQDTEVSRSAESYQE